MSSAAAIVVAAGPGSRLGGNRPKAFVELGGIPLVVHAVRALLGAPSVGSVVVVAPAPDREAARALFDRHGPWRCPLTIVAGGAERADSVRSGLAAVNAALIAVHDAARPFVSPAVVEAAIAAADQHGAAIVAVPATDTVKQVHPEGWIESTPQRDHLWLAQTPQVFRADLLRSAHARAAAASTAITDDSMLVEALGVRVHVVRGNPENRKITTPEDLQWAEWLLAHAARGGGPRPPRSR